MRNFTTRNYLNKSLADDKCGENINGKFIENLMPVDKKSGRNRLY